ncbi:DUF4878 domain-containing protein [Chryseolinea soli]|uniref:DUF4878 domain-containing protein n=1 Tax=Chryseolinea soli TaxID=2321403 RepID=A0A385STT9_9BACT|nr:DUF4878 domain-containing protein [Chryseolinea soli]AYB32228.1 DUF4878 domain-containing protein [Chryseolinea soli]
MRYLLRILTITTAFALLSCGSDSPEETVKQFLKNVDNFEYDKAEACVTDHYRESLDNIKKASAEWSESKKQTYKKLSKAYNVLLKEKTDSTASVFVGLDGDSGMPLRTMFFLKKRDGKWLIDQTEEQF